MSNLPYKNSVEPGRYPIELIWFDLMGPLPVTGSHGERYLAHAMCDRTKWGMVKALKHKSQALDFFLEFKKLLERDGQTIRRVRADGGELASSGLFKQHYT